MTASQRPAQMSSSMWRFDRDSLTRLAVGLVAAAVMGCLPNDLLKATSDLGTATKGMSAHLANTQGLVAELCRTEAELDYLIHLAKSRTAFASWTDYYTRAPLPIAATSGSRGMVSTWSGWCDGMRKVDDGFIKIALAIGAYGAALGQAAESHSLSATNITGLTTSAADDVAAFVPWAQPYKSTLDGIGSPLATIANGLLTIWVGRKVKEVVDESDRPLQEALNDLGRFLGVVQDELLSYTDTYRSDLVLQGSEEPIAVAVVDFDVSRKLDAMRTELASLAAAVKTLAAAHGTLRRGWVSGCCTAEAQAAREVSAMALALTTGLHGTDNRGN